MNFKTAIVAASIRLVSCSGVFAQQFEEPYRNNVLSLSPLQITNRGVGLALNYERVLDKQGIVALTVPVAMSFSNANNEYYYATNRRYNTLFVLPGLKFYPTGNKKKVSYALGPSVAIAVGERPVGYYLNYPFYSYNVMLKNGLTVGTMLFNYLDINPTKRLYMGLDIGMGVGYIDQLDGVSTGYLPFLFQMGFKLGYRF